MKRQGSQWGAVPLLPRGRPESGLISRRLRALSVKSVFQAFGSRRSFSRLAVSCSRDTDAIVPKRSRRPGSLSAAISRRWGPRPRQLRRRFAEPWRLRPSVDGCRGDGASAGLVSAAGLKFVTTPRLSAIPSQSLRLDVKGPACKPSGAPRITARLATRRSQTGCAPRTPMHRRSS